MKTLTLLFALFAGFQFSQAAVLTVNNNNPSPGQFSTIPAAVAAASNGDTIYVHGSANPYSETINLSKQLTFIGAGLLPASASGSISRISGSTLFLLGSGDSKFIGLYFLTQVTFTSGGTGTRNNITFDRCAFFSTFVISGNGWSINRCVIGNILKGNTGGNNGFLTFSASPQNTIFSNNVIINNSGAGVTQTENINTTYSRNLFLRIASGSIAFQTSATMQEAMFFENIAIGLNLVTNCSNCNYVNNLTFIPSYMTPVTLPDLNAFAGSSGNITGNPLFTAFPNSTTVAQYDLANPAVFNPVLLPGSPALTAGATNSEIGLFGGVIPFNMFGEPDLPIVRNFIIQNLVVPAGTNLQIEFTATPNN